MDDKQNINQLDTLVRLEKLAWLMDAAIKLPGGFRIGLDGLIGLIPGVGDVIGMLVSFYLLYSARSIKAPRSIQLRMVGNILLEFVVGLIPLLGDIFDFYFKSNQRNMALLRQYLTNR